MPEELECDLLILGASFTGIELVYQILRRNGKLPGKTVIVDRRNEHEYIPLCHELLCGRLLPQGASLPTQQLLEGIENCCFFTGGIHSFDPGLHEVKLEDGRCIRGKICVFALGSELRASIQSPKSWPKRVSEQSQTLERENIPLLTHKFGDEWKTATEHIQWRMSQNDAARRIVVVGGGISGVELAGELAYCLGQRSDTCDIGITLLHSRSRLLTGLCRRAGLKAQEILEELDVDVRLNSRMLRVHPWGAQFQTEITGRSEDASSFEQIELACDLGFWAGGVCAPKVLHRLGLVQTNAHWLQVSPTLQCRRVDGVQDFALFAGGDNARIVSGTGEWSTMQRAIECIWQAKNLAKNILTAFADIRNYLRQGASLKPHSLRKDFPHGVSIGNHSLVVYGNIVWDGKSKAISFRRFLMKKYMDRYQNSMAPRFTAIGKFR